MKPTTMRHCVVSLAAVACATILSSCTADNANFMPDGGGTSDGTGGVRDGSGAGSDGSAGDASAVADGAIVGSSDLSTGGCGPGEMLCGSGCVAAAGDPQHCGSCGNVCGGATPLCMGTSCVARCSGGLTDCNGGCVDTMTDPANCGGCGMSCGALRSCVNGACSGSCASSLPGVMLCGGQCVDTMNDALNCGACNKPVCHLEICTGGKAACAPGLTACGATGCLGCRNLAEDPENCGKCGTRCAGKVCAGGVCAAACGAGTTQCGNACVADPMTDQQHCGCTAGTLGKTCSPGEICVAGMCEGYTSSFGCNSCPCAACVDPNPTCCQYPAGRIVCITADACP